VDASLIETWQIHNRILIYMLGGISAEGLADSAAPRQRTVGDHLAHIHNVRLMWLKVAAPDLMDSLVKLEKEVRLDAETLRASLEDSGRAVEELLRRSDEKIKGFKPHASAFVGYLISHEGYHSGKVDLILRMNGHAMDDKAHYGMWEWGVR
jgi:uncharacterized damage-inducible protein DinB